MESSDAEDHEVEDIVIEFEGNFDFDGVTDKPVQIIGIESEEPILKIDSKFYKINIQDSIGTRLIFKYDERDESKLKYYTKTDKLVRAHRIMVKPKGQRGGEE